MALLVTVLCAAASVLLLARRRQLLPWRRPQTVIGLPVAAGTPGATGAPKAVGAPVQRAAALSPQAVAQRRRRGLANSAARRFGPAGDNIREIGRRPVRR